MRLFCKQCSEEINEKPWLSYRDYNEDIKHICGYGCSIKNGCVGIDNWINKEDFSFLKPIVNMKYYKEFYVIEDEEYDKLDPVDKYIYNYEYEKHISHDPNYVDWAQINYGSDDDDSDIYSDSCSVCSSIDDYLDDY
tara:strand:+ start:3757 stop:4167 length:411 start_codon:yes stop_codon:yes gene_type:complete